MKFGIRYCNTGRYVDPAKAVEILADDLYAAEVRAAIEAGTGIGKTFAYLLPVLLPLPAPLPEELPS